MCVVNSNSLDHKVKPGHLRPTGPVKFLELAGRELRDGFVGGGLEFRRE